jgi:hypothetical protein
MTNSSVQIPGADPFERADFEATDLDKVNQQTGAVNTPKVTLCTSTGQRLTFSLTDQSGHYKNLAAWATKLAEELEAEGR